MDAGPGTESTTDTDADIDANMDIEMGRAMEWGLGMEMGWLMDTDMDTNTSIDEDVVETAKCSNPHGRRLDNLPSEILDLIGNHLDRKDIRRLRDLSNRNICDGFSHVFTKLNFHHRKCITRDESITHLDIISNTQYADDVRSLDIRLYLECRAGAPSDVRVLSPQCVSAYLDLDHLQRVLIAFFGRTKNLQGVIIRAPTKESLSMSSDTQHQHTIDIMYVQELLHTISRAIGATIHPRIQKFRLLGFSKSQWEARMTPVLLTLDFLMFCGLGMPNLTTLNLELEMEIPSSSLMPRILVTALEGCPKLQVLKLHPGPNTSLDFEKRSDNWAPLLQLLGTDPPFRLRTLEVNGLVTSTTAPTLDRVIDVHASTLRRIRLHHLNFHYPNSPRAFFTALSKADIRYFATRCFKLHNRSFIRNSTLACIEWEDEVLNFDVVNGVSKDESYRDWVEIDWKIHHGDKELLYDYEEWTGHARPMEGVFMSVVEQVISGAIRDS